MGWFSNEYCGERKVSLTYLRVLEVKQLYKVEGLIRYQSPDWFYLLAPLVVEGLAIAQVRA